MGIWPGFHIYFPLQFSQQLDVGRHWYSDVIGEEIGAQRSRMTCLSSRSCKVEGLTFKSRSLRFPNSSLSPTISHVQRGELGSKKWLEDPRLLWWAGQARVWRA